MSHGTLTLLEGGARLKLRLPTHHFHPILERYAQKRLAPKDGESYSVVLLESYFSEHLELMGPKGEVLHFTVVAQELDPTDLVLTLEVLAPSLKGWTLKHTVLLESEPRQKNLITVEGVGPRRGCRTRRRPVYAPWHFRGVGPGGRGWVGIFCLAFRQAGKQTFGRWVFEEVTQDKSCGTKITRYFFNLNVFRWMGVWPI
jgi:hypothetical protein